MTTADEVRAAALGLASAEERETWGRPTFRIGDAIFAALHDDLLILRGTPDTQAGRLREDPRMRQAPYWGRYGWVAIPVSEVSESELPALLAAAHALAA